MLIPEIINLTIELYFFNLSKLEDRNFFINYYLFNFYPQFVGFNIPRMIDDALKLTVDATFKKKSSYTSSDIQNIDISNVRDPGYSFPVTGYPNDENMWECILNLNYC